MEVPRFGQHIAVARSLSRPSPASPEKVGEIFKQFQRSSKDPVILTGASRQEELHNGGEGIALDSIIPDAPETHEFSPFGESVYMGSPELILTEDDKCSFLGHYSALKALDDENEARHGSNNGYAPKYAKGYYEAHVYAPGTTRMDLEG